MAETPVLNWCNDADAVEPTVKYLVLPSKPAEVSSGQLSLVRQRVTINEGEAVRFIE